MSDSDNDAGEPTVIFHRVNDWISSHDFHNSEVVSPPLIETNLPDGVSDLTSVTKNVSAVVTQRATTVIPKPLTPPIGDWPQHDGLIVEERTDEINCCGSLTRDVRSEAESKEDTGPDENFLKTMLALSKNSKFASGGDRKKHALHHHHEEQHSIISEGEECPELPENRRSEISSKILKSLKPLPSGTSFPFHTPSRPQSRHKRQHADTVISNKISSSADKKSRKRRTLERVGASVEERQKILEEIVSNRQDRQNKRRQQRRFQTEQFLKSMQMLQANAKPDKSQPFEDYSIFLYRQTATNFEDRVKDLEKKFTYVPDHESKLPNLTRGNADEDFAARIKSIEDRWREPQPVDKKPKDLMRAIGKIETSDWNIREIEKKIRENKQGKPSSKDKEKVPKWSKEEFLARQTKMEKKHLERQDSAEAKFADIDKNIKHLELKLKEGTARDLGQNKVATITEKLASRVPDNAESRPIQKSQSRPAIVLPAQGGSEFCHFCGKRVYLMERLSAEGRFFHHGCFKCQYCHTQLRLGSYAFDRDGFYDHKFFCIHHYGMQGELKQTKVFRKPSQRLAKDSARSPEKKHLTGIAGVDLLDRVRTPERVEFSNLSVANTLSDHEESLSQMDEDEWTDKNFGASTAELGSSDDEDSSSLSDSDSDDEDAYEEALEEPATKEGTLKWAERFNRRYSKKRNDSESDNYSSSDQSSYYENTSDDEDSETATEGEEEIRARELRRQEVRVEPPVVQTDTGTDTEVVSDESSSDSSSEVRNSATEISTDSEFAHDDPTPTREIPTIVFNDFNVTKSRGTGAAARKIQVTSGFLQRPAKNGNKRETGTLIGTKSTARPSKKDHSKIDLKLTPLVPSSPSLAASRKPAPLLLPRTEGYALNRTQSTGGIAAKVSLELKKKYLLGESTGPNSIQKSGSVSTLDTKLKMFGQHVASSISDCQKLLKPAPEISPSMQTFCNKLDERTSPLQTSPTPPITQEVEVHEKGKIGASRGDAPAAFENELEGRPRSPVHETSIIVPTIDWSKQKSDLSDDSLSEDSVEAGDNIGVAAKLPTFDSIPTVLIDDIPPDSLCLEEVRLITCSDSTASGAPLKSISSEKKTLNQPKLLPGNAELPDIHDSLHVAATSTSSNGSKRCQSVDHEATRSSDDSTAEVGTAAALTETELSDWAREGTVSDDFEDGDFFAECKTNSRNAKKPKTVAAPEEQKDSDKFDVVTPHVCGLKTSHFDIAETVNTAFNVKDFDNIEFMDTGTETSSDDGLAGENSQNGYVLFKDDDELLAEDSLNPVVEAKNAFVVTQPKNTGYCVVLPDNNFGGEVMDLQPGDVEKLKNQHKNTDHDEDSLLILDTGTTTEENTCSDSTVKNVTQIAQDIQHNPIENNNFQRKRLEEKLAKLKAEQALSKQQQEQQQQHNYSQRQQKENHIEYDEHCRRLQSKVEFGNAKDSIDIRKSRRKSKTDTPQQQKPDLIQEEEQPRNVRTPEQASLPVLRTPDVLYKKEFIEKERDVNQRLIQEMVMNKMKAENKSLERKRRSRPGPNFELRKSATTDIVSEINMNILDNSATNSSSYATPDLLSSLKKPVSVLDIEVFATPLTSVRPLSVFTTANPIDDSLKNNVSVPDARKVLFQNDDFKTPIAPPRVKHEEAKRTAEKLRQDAKVRARLMSNEELGLSPEDKLNKLREKFKRVKQDECPQSCFYPNDTLQRKKNGSFRRSQSTEEQSLQLPLRTKSIPEISTVIHHPMPLSPAPKPISICKSDPNLLDTDSKKLQPSKKKPASKDKERRKSLTKIISNLFAKKSPTQKGLFSRISPKSRDISKSCVNLDFRDKSDVVIEEPTRRRSLSEVRTFRIETPPPVPPLPLNYTGHSIKGTDDSSDGEHDWKHADRSSCDTLDQSGVFDTSISSLSKRRTSKGARKAARQAQLKRHRTAQEIQRKLEEIEVKMRDLEERGVVVEKALRGEDNKRYSKEESELLQEWFDLMRDRTELRRYEKELTIRAQELELEDRHARMQHELRERLGNEEAKTQEDVEIESSIIKEMMEIVSQRDSLILVLEEDRLRYSNEDKDFEEQMLAKGLSLTPIRKSPEK